MMEKDTGPAFDSDTDSLEAISEAIADLITRTKGLNDIHDDLVIVLADTNELQTDWANGGRLDLLIDAILADTGELQTDWTDGGRLDLIIDAIKTQIDKLSGSDADTETGALNLFTGERTIFEISKATRYKLAGAFIRMDGTTPVTAGATITIRFYVKVNGSYVKVAEQAYIKDTDPDGIIIVDSLFGATGDVKVTGRSDNAGDTATTVPYQYIIEEME